MPQSPCVSMHLAPSTHDRHLLQSASAATAASASRAVALARPACTALAGSSVKPSLCHQRCQRLTATCFPASTNRALCRPVQRLLSISIRCVLVRARLHAAASSPPPPAVYYNGLPPLRACGFFSAPSSCCNIAVTASICLPPIAAASLPHPPQVARRSLSGEGGQMPDEPGDG